ncbi:unnamed protein product, partial [marine sediment metagenome]
MGKVKIDIVKAIEMRVNGATLREIGSHFNASAEAVRQAIQRADKQKREQEKLARLLVSASIGEQGIAKSPADIAKSPADIAKTIDDWIVILEAAKKGIALESEVASFKERLSRVELLVNLREKQ